MKRKGYEDQKTLIWMMHSEVVLKSAKRSCEPQLMNLHLSWIKMTVRLTVCWFNGFQVRNTVKTVSGESGSVDVKAAISWKQNMMQIISLRDAKD